MNISIDTEVLTNFPDLKLYVLHAQDFNNQETSPELTKSLRDVEKHCRDTIDLETLATHPVVSEWRNAYRSFGFKPSSYKCSIEALLRRVLKDGEIPTISYLVDCYNLISLKYLVPVGADDLSNIAGSIRLGYTKGDEPFTKLGSDETETAAAGEIAYMDDKEILCRAWNWRECDKSKITETTTHASVVIEGLKSTSKDTLVKATEELSQLLSIKTSTPISQHYLDSSTPSISLS